VVVSVSPLLSSSPVFNSPYFFGKSFLFPQPIFSLSPPFLSSQLSSPSVADPDPGSNALLTPGSGIRIWDGGKFRIRD
jgi:hypothetical protein